MSNILSVADEHRAYRNQGTIDFLSLGSGPATLELYDTPKPSPGGDPGGSPNVIIELADPPGIIVDFRIRLIMADSIGYMITSGGDILWGRLKNGAGAYAGDGDVSDAAGGGVFRLAGTGIHLYAGGYALLAADNLIG